MMIKKTIFVLFLIIFSFNIFGVDITDCQALSAGFSYNLTQDIINHSGSNCFTGTGAVTLDCQGHIIDGTNDDTALYFTSGINVFKNCIITDWQNGVVTSGSNNLVENITLTGITNYGFKFGSGSNGGLQNSILRDLSVDMCDQGINIYSYERDIRDNLFENIYLTNCDYGIYPNWGCNSGSDNMKNNTFNNIQIYNMTQRAFWIKAAAGGTCTGTDWEQTKFNNLTLKNNNYGLYLHTTGSGIRYNNITNSTITDNNYGIYMYQETGILRYNTLFKNTIMNNSVDDITFSGGAAINTFYLNILSNSSMILGGTNFNTWNTTINGTAIGNYWNDFSGCSDTYIYENYEICNDTDYLVGGSYYDYAPIVSIITSSPPPQPQGIGSSSSIFPSYGLFSMIVTLILFVVGFFKFLK